MTSTDAASALKSPWSRVAETAPEFAAETAALFRAFPNKTLATLRKDGSPRLAAIELWMTEEHAVVILMAQSAKARDIRRDPRISVLSGSSGASDVPVWPTARISGRVAPVAEAALEASLLEAAGVPAEFGAGSVFLIDIDEVVITRIGDNTMETVLWKDGRLRHIGSN
ncbi:pyridoxamine 5'-phosphate oxidase family protein [Nocardia pseudovaccinii]|uniref:pyridoxamine 5'-phosphate oxidase family protein n=1 Tax=Nocardia pseudovaccinii TaxID=189540 RepID=UPI003D91123C